MYSDKCSPSFEPLIEYLVVIIWKCALSSLFCRVYKTATCPIVFGRFPSTISPNAFIQQPRAVIAWRHRPLRLYSLQESTIIQLLLSTDSFLICCVEVKRLNYRKILFWWVYSILFWDIKITSLSWLFFKA